MITNKNKTIKKKKSPLLAKIKFEPTFFSVLWQFAFPLPLFGEAGGRGVRGEFRPPRQKAEAERTISIFSNPALRDCEAVPRLAANFFI